MNKKQKELLQALGKEAVQFKKKRLGHLDKRATQQHAEKNHVNAAITLNNNKDLETLLSATKTIICKRLHVKDENISIKITKDKKYLILKQKDLPVLYFSNTPKLRFFLQPNHRMPVHIIYHKVKIVARQSKETQFLKKQLVEKHKISNDALRIYHSETLKGYVIYQKKRAICIVLCTEW